HDAARLSPAMKYSPSGTCQVSPKCALSNSRLGALRYGSLSFSNSFAPGPRIQMKPLASSRTVSPGRPIKRLTNVPPSPHFNAAPPGVLKTTMSPREGAPKGRQIRHASTRSSDEPRQPGAGLAQFRVGSMAEEVIRYGRTATVKNTT